MKATTSTRSTRGQADLPDAGASYISHTPAHPPTHSYVSAANDTTSAARARAASGLKQNIGAIPPPHLSVSRHGGGGGMVRVVSGRNAPRAC